MVPMSAPDSSDEWLVVGAAAVLGCALIWAAKRVPARTNTAFLNELAGEPFLYHESKREHLADIASEGIVPSSYGQWFVGDQGEMLTPDDFSKRELRACPAADLKLRTYVLLSEPTRFNYGDVLLRFPRHLARPTRKHDVDWYILETIPPSAIEVRDGNAWRRLT
jgi:hypothetical protein